MSDTCSDSESMSVKLVNDFDRSAAGTAAGKTQSENSSGSQKSITPQKGTKKMKRMCRFRESRKTTYAYITPVTGCQYTYITPVTGNQYTYITQVTGCQYAYITPITGNVYRANCTLCKWEFGIGHGGEGDIKTHMSSESH